MKSKPSQHDLHRISSELLRHTAALDADAIDRAYQKLDGKDPRAAVHALAALAMRDCQSRAETAPPHLSQAFAQTAPLRTALIREIRQRARVAFSDFISAWAEIRTYGDLLGFSLRQVARSDLAWATGLWLVAACVMELLAPLAHLAEPLHVDPGSRAVLGIGLLLTAAACFWAHRAQTRSAQRYTVLLRALRTLSGEIGDLDFSDCADRRERSIAYLQKVLATFNIVFSESNGAFSEWSESRFQIYSTVLLPDGDSDLVGFCEEPLRSYYFPNRAAIRCGDEGRSAWTGSLVYVPRVSHRHGIQITEDKGPPPVRILRLQHDAFQLLDDTPPPFRSVLCAPLAFSSPDGIGRRNGVLCVGSTATAAFGSEFHFGAVQLAAGLITGVLEKYLEVADLTPDRVTPVIAESAEAATQDSSKTAAPWAYPNIGGFRHVLEGEPWDRVTQVWIHSVLRAFVYGLLPALILNTAAFVGSMWHMVRTCSRAPAPENQG